MYSYSRLAYDYDRRRKVANASDQLVELGIVVEKVGQQIAKIVGTNPDDSITPHRVASLLKALFDLARRKGASVVFLEILREYEMGPADRKTIERAAKLFSKSRVVVKPEKALATYAETLYQYGQLIDTARGVLQKNEKHTDEGSTTTEKVGSFTLVNTGGFPEKVMAECAKVVARSEKLLRQKGLGKVCYGDVHVTNTVHKSTRVLAFYMLGSDTLYVRANLKGKQGPAVQSVIHELGHRLQFRFLQSKKREINAVYQALLGKKETVIHDLVMDRSRWPKEGDTLDYKGETFAFDKIDLTSRAQLKVVFRLVDQTPSFKITVPLHEYMLNQHPEIRKDASVFVTNYAATDPDENFAEMVAFHCEDKLPDDQVVMLKGLIE